MTYGKTMKKDEITQEEYSAIDEKTEHPDKEVRCPRCGRMLIYEIRGNSIAVKCPKPRCIYGGIRGL